MNSPMILGHDLNAEGRAFASRQAILVQHSSGKQFKEQTLLAVASAFALARYTDEQVRKKLHPDNRRKKTPGIQRLEGATRLLRSSAIEIQSALPILGKLPFARSVTGVETPRILGVAQALLNAAKYEWSLSEPLQFSEGIPNRGAAQSSRTVDLPGRAETGAAGRNSGAGARSIQ